MLIDPTIPLPWILGYIILSLLAIAGFVIRVLLLETRVKQAETEITNLKDKITDVEFNQKQEIKEVNINIQKMWTEFHNLNINLNRLIFEKTADK